METPDFDAEDFPLFEVAVETWGGFVFVVPRAAIRRRSSRRRGYENYGFDELRIGKRIVADVKANWKLLAENFSECFHCPPVHPELCRVVTAYQDAGAWGLQQRAGDEPEYKAGATTLTLDGTSRLPPFARSERRRKTNPLHRRRWSCRTCSSTSSPTT